MKPEKLIPRPAADVGTLVHFRRRISNRILFSKALDTREVGRRAVLVATAMLVGLGGRTHAASGMDSGKWSGTQIRMETLAEAVARLRSRACSFPMARYPDPILRRVAKPVAESAFQSPEDSRYRFGIMFDFPLLLKKEPQFLTIRPMIMNHFGDS